jgi:hypothetical protein
VCIFCLIFPRFIIATLFIKRFGKNQKRLIATIHMSPPTKTLRRSGRRLSSAYPSALEALDSDTRFCIFRFLDAPSLRAVQSASSQCCADARPIFLDSQWQAQALPLMTLLTQGQAHEKAVVIRARTEAGAVDILKEAFNRFDLFQNYFGAEHTAELVCKLLAARRVLLPSSDEDLLASVFVAGATLYRDGVYGRAEKLFHEMLNSSLVKEKLGPRHPATLNVVCVLVMTLVAQRKYEEAEPLAREALAHMEAVLEPHDRCTLFMRSALAQTLQALGNEAEAEPLLRESLQGWRDVMGPHDDKTLGALQGLISCLFRTRPFFPSEVVSLSRELLEGLRSRHGVGHELTNATRTLLVTTFLLCSFSLLLQCRFFEFELLVHELTQLPHGEFELCGVDGGILATCGLFTTMLELHVEEGHAEGGKSVARTIRSCDEKRGEGEQPPQTGESARCGDGLSDDVARLAAFNLRRLLGEVPRQAVQVPVGLGGEPRACDR